MAKFIITENRLETTIVNYLNKKYGGLTWTYGIDDDGDYNKCGLAYVKVDDYDYDDVFFRVYQKCWWDVQDGTTYSKEMFEESPILIFENTEDYNTLTSYFGKHWVELFKKWFEKTYDLELKTVSW